MWTWQASEVTGGFACTAILSIHLVSLVLCLSGSLLLLVHLFPLPLNCSLTGLHWDNPATHIVTFQLCLQLLSSHSLIICYSQEEVGEDLAHPFVQCLAWLSWASTASHQVSEFQIPILPSPPWLSFHLELTRVCSAGQLVLRVGATGTGDCPDSVLSPQLSTTLSFCVVENTSVCTFYMEAFV